jgi:8-oxo-dGTP diphosphatase
MDMINVVCGVIHKSNQIFIAKRKPEKSLGGFWEFPGGKVEVGEKFEDTLIRELHEELGMKVKLDEYLTSIEHNYENFKIKLIAYKCEFVNASFKMTDHDQYEWVCVENLLSWKLAPADIPIAEFVILKKIDKLQ